MAAVEVAVPFNVFTDVDGDPLEDGYIYIGAPNQNPQISPVQAYWDFDLTIPATQPIRTRGGYPSNGGTPARFFVGVESHSILVSNKNGTVIHSSMESEDLSSLLANSDDTAKGAALIGRAIRQIRSMAELGTVAGRYDGDQVILLGYHADLAGIGGGVFSWSSTSVATADDALVVDVSGVTNGRWLRVFSGVSVDPTWFGARPGADSTSALVACHASGRNVAYPPGKFIHSLVGGIQLTEGQQIFGAGGHRFTTPEVCLTWLECAAPGGIFAVYEDTSAAVQRSGPGIFDCYVLADNGIRIGSLSTLVTAQGLSMKPIIARNIFQARTVSTGRGLTMVGCFDHQVSNNEFRQFDNHLLMVGCDIGDIHNNRMTFHVSYAILELSAAPSFGSQNKIRNNDILVGDSVDSVFIRSTSQQVRIFDNYLEQGQSRNLVKGFIDTSLTDIPQVGINTTSSIQQSVVVEDNRIDGHNMCSEYLYKINPKTSYSRLKDAGATGTETVSTAPWLVLGGGEIGLFVRFNVFNYCNWEISGGASRFAQKFPQFKTKASNIAGGVFAVDSESLGCLDHAALNSNNACDHVRLHPDAFAVLSGLGVNWLHLVPQPAEDIINPTFESAVTYNVEVVARCTVAGEQILTGRSNGGGLAAGDVSAAMTLSTQYQRFTSTITGQAESTVTGLAIRRNAVNSGTVFIKSIKISKA